MKKKVYQKPSTRVVELQSQSNLLTTSGNQWLNYIPATPDSAENHLS